MASNKTKLAIVAVGGNALISDKDHLAIADQYNQVTLTVRHITDMIVAGWEVIVTHGNGPQMGFILRRSELSLHEVAPVPMDYAGAVVTQTLVDPADPAFQKPTKPIGSHMDEATAKRLAKQQGWTVAEDAGRGWRRVVPSPRPVAIVERDVIAFLARAGYVVVAVGGGGIPVIADAAGNLHGAEAVIDKDFATSLLARQIKADLLLVSTGVERVAINFNKPNQRWLDRMSVSEAKRYYADDQL